MGGLANMMFQIAKGESWREKGYDIVYTDIDENLDFIAKNYTPGRLGREYKHIFANFDWDKYKAPVNTNFCPKTLPFTYIDLIPEEGVEYIGYFQSEKWFYGKSFVRNLFKPSDIVFNMLINSFRLLDKIVSCSIHVRRQDYLKLSDYHTNLTMDYYNHAIEVMNVFHIDKFFVFSDDLEWCERNFIGDKFFFVDDKDYLCMYIMGYCNHNIIANSSLSWFSAFLNENPYKVVICPEKWFGPKGQNSIDLIPKEWIQI